MGVDRSSRSAEVPSPEVEPRPGRSWPPGLTGFPLLHSFAPHLHPDLHHTKPGSAPYSPIWWRYSGIPVMFAPAWISQAPGAGSPAPAGRLSVLGVNGVNDYSDQYLSLSIYLLWNNPHCPRRHLCLHFSRNSGANLVQRCNHDCGRISGPAVIISSFSHIRPTLSCGTDRTHP